MIQIGPYRIHVFWLLTAVILLLRAATLGLYPLMDTTEARYGEMARIMVETGNWLTPHLDYNIPFWGKPPLQNWMSAVGIEIFGNNEFAVRFPHFLAGLGILFIVWQFSNSMTGNEKLAQKTVLILSTTLAFIISSGVVMTDTALTLGMTLALYGFYQKILHPDKPIFSHLFFVGISIGLLAKGPLVLVLIALTIAPWALLEYGITGAFKIIFKSLNWFSGFIIVTVLALSWYYLAEQATPGFLKYFIVGEHISRFLDPGWKGDLYGAGHVRPKGMIWLFWLVYALPWSPLLVHDLIKYRSTLLIPGRRSKTLFLLFWMLSPLILFTFASNILIAYVLPGIPAMALLMSELSLYHSRKLMLLFSTSTVVVMVAIIYSLTTPMLESRSDKELLSHRNSPKLAVYYLNHVTYSGKYYTEGKARQTSDFNHQKPFYMVLPLAKISMATMNRCQTINNNKKRILVFCDQ